MGKRIWSKRVAVVAVLTLAAVGVMLGPRPSSSFADGNEAPSAPSPYRALTAGSAHTCAIVNSGQVKCWGNNIFGRLGLGDSANRGDGGGEMGTNLPTVALGTGRTATALAAGSAHTCALLDDGSVKCWGPNGNGRLGLGDTSARGDAAGEMGDNLPAVSLGTGRTASAITAGINHTCALLDDATVKCWGFNGAGQLGQGDTNARGDAAGEMGDDLPAIDLGAGRTAVAITAGSAFTCALLDTGSVKCWGENLSGRLGLGDSTDRGDNAGEMGDDLPAVQLGAGRTVLAVSSGDAHTCVLLDDATTKCWGENASGRLGHGDTDDRGDDAGEMGDGLATVSLGTGRQATGISAGDAHTCALLDDATTKCWGENGAGQLGLGNTADRGDNAGEMGDSLTATDLGAGRTAASVSTGGPHSCASLDNGALRCWGTNVSGQLGLGDTLARGDAAGEMGDNLPVVDLRPGRAVITLGTGTQHACALLDNGTVKCWGVASSGQLGTGNTATLGDQSGEMGDNLTTVALGAGRTAIALAVGGIHNCVILDTGQVKCWGSGSTGRLGTGDTADRGNDPNEMGDNLPAVDLGTGRTATAITAGALHTCALLDTGEVKCWGFNTSGQLGLGDTANRGDGLGEMGDDLPSVDLGAGRTATSIAAAGNRNCALLDNGALKCWGENTVAQLGLGDSANRGDDPGEMGDNLPAVALGTGRTAVALGVGTNHACAVLDDATLKCWGNGGFGKLGLGDNGSRGGPGTMGDALPTVSLGTGRTATSVSADGNHTCAVLDNATVKCWGHNDAGQLGLGDGVDRGDQPGELGDNLPGVPLGAGRAATAVSVGNNDGFTCATLDNATAKCWGVNAFGQLGQGDVTVRGDQAGEMGDALPAIDLGSAAPLGVSGTVTATGSGAPVPRAFVAVLRATDFAIAGGAVADPAGNYRVELPPGNYFAYVIDPAGRHVAGFAGSPTAVDVTGPGLIDRDATLAPTRGSVTGKIREAGSEDPLPGSWALALTAGGAPEVAALADGDAGYELGDLTAGSHYVGWVDPNGGHAPRFSVNSPNVPDANPVTVTAGGAAERDGSLPVQTSTPGGAALTGTVTQTGTNAPLPGILVIAQHAADFRLARAETTNAAGQYSLDVAAGSYKLVFLDPTGAHAMEWHDNQPYFGLANAANVTAPAATNAALDRTTGTMTGTLTDSVSGAPLAGAWAFAISPTGTVTGAVTNPNGTYTIAGLPPGTYRATFVDPVGGGAQEYYDNSPDYFGGTNINITAGATTPGINAGLAKP